MSIGTVGGPNFSAIFSSALPVRTRRDSSAPSDPSNSVVPPASDTVTLSADAQATASLNAQGITLTYVSGPSLSEGGQPSFPAAAAYGSVSKSDFEAVAARFGATAQQADQDFEALDGNGNGLISNAELLGAMSGTGQGDSDLSQSLLQMMDANHDGSVSGSEFLNLETALVAAEK
jgi:hypothetical protein